MYTFGSSSELLEIDLMKLGFQINPKNSNTCITDTKV